MEDLIFWVFIIFPIFCLFSFFIVWKVHKYTMEVYRTDLASQYKKRYEESNEKLKKAWQDVLNKKETYEFLINNIFCDIPSMEKSEIQAPLLNIANYYKRDKLEELSEALSEKMSFEKLSVECNVTDAEGLNQVSLSNCNCDEFLFGNGEPCKHMIALSARLGLLLKSYPNFKRNCENEIKKLEKMYSSTISFDQKNAPLISKILSFYKSNSLLFQKNIELNNEETEKDIKQLTSYDHRFEDEYFREIAYVKIFGKNPGEKEGLKWPRS